MAENCVLSLIVVKKRSCSEEKVSLKTKNFGYNVPLSEIKEGLKFRCELEPFNAREENSIVFMSVAYCHLARKACH